MKIEGLWIKDCDQDGLEFFRPAYVTDIDNLVDAYYEAAIALSRLEQMAKGTNEAPRA